MIRLLAIALALTFAFAVPAHAGQIRLAGYSSWYGGPCDSEDNNQTASGIPNRVPGFATRWVPFGKWFLIADRNGRGLGMSLERGPASWTGRNIDLNYTLAGRLGYPVTSGGCVLGYPNGWVTAEQIVVGLRYPSCGWAGRMAGRYLRHRVRKLGRPGNCLIGTAARAMRRYQLRLHRPKAARSGTVTLGTWRALLVAR